MIAMAIAAACGTELQIESDRCTGSRGASRRTMVGTCGHISDAAVPASTRRKQRDAARGGERPSQRADVEPSEVQVAWSARVMAPPTMSRTAAAIA